MGQVRQYQRKSGSVVRAHDRSDKSKTNKPVAYYHAYCDADGFLMTAYKVNPITFEGDLDKYFIMDSSDLEYTLLPADEAKFRDVELDIAHNDEHYQAAARGVAAEMRSRLRKMGYRVRRVEDI